jgi:hypothetical protein
METPVTDDYMESDHTFAGKIVQVTITRQDMKPLRWWRRITSGHSKRGPGDSGAHNCLLVEFSLMSGLLSLEPAERRNGGG